MPARPSLEADFQLCMLPLRLDPFLRVLGAWSLESPDRRGAPSIPVERSGVDDRAKAFIDGADTAGDAERNCSLMAKRVLRTNCARDICDVKSAM